MTLVGLVDCNNFFVSCERLFRPDLLTRPVLVLSSNDGCVVARSQEVKDMNIPMGVPYFKIKDIIKDSAITVFSGNLALYRDISQRVFSITREEFNTVEQYSVDEAFFLIEDDDGVEGKLHQVRDRIAKEVGIPVSIGVAGSKTLTKFATDFAKKNTGVTVLTETQVIQEVNSKELSSVWGVGRGLAERYRAAGIKTVTDLLQVDTAILGQRFGVVAVRQQAELRGEMVHRVERVRPAQKSIMSSKSFKKTTNDKALLADAVSYHARHIAADLREMQAQTSVIRLSLSTSRHGDFFMQGGSAEALLPIATNDTLTVVQTAQELLDQLYHSGIPYQKVSVVVSSIQSCGAQSLSLFEEDTSDRGSLMKAIDTINQASNKELVTVGSRLQTTRWQPKSAARSKMYTTQWNDLCVVSAS